MLGNNAQLSYYQRSSVKRVHLGLDVELPFQRSKALSQTGEP